MSNIWALVNVSNFQTRDALKNLVRYCRSKGVDLVINHRKGGETYLQPLETIELEVNSQFEIVEVEGEDITPVREQDHE